LGNDKRGMSELGASNWPLDLEFPWQHCLGTTGTTGKHLLVSALLSGFVERRQEEPINSLVVSYQNFFTMCKSKCKQKIFVFIDFSLQVNQ